MFLTTYLGTLHAYLGPSNKAKSKCTGMGRKLGATNMASALKTAQNMLTYGGHRGNTRNNTTKLQSKK